jgi:hypothetical protein
MVADKFYCSTTTLEKATLLFYQTCSSWKLEEESSRKAAAGTTVVS